MKHSYLKLLEDAEKHGDAGLSFSFLISIQRSLLQYAALSAIELYCETIRDDDAVGFDDLLLRVHTPTDATPIDVLDQLIPVIRQFGWGSFCLGWYEKSSSVEGTVFDEPLVGLLSRWVAFRNERQGHGVIDEHTVLHQRQWLMDLIRHSLFVLDSALPQHRGDDAGDHVFLSTPEGERRLKCLCKVNGSPIIVRKITSRRGRWRLQYQTLDIYHSAQGEYELDPSSPLVSFSPSLQKRYTSFHVPLKTGDWRPLVLLPNRQTSSFEGREEELHDLKDWYNDVDSRACLIYGDGGIGKTTLVLEFMHDLLESRFSDLSFRPYIICFYSAKQTRWTSEGVIHLKGIAPVIEEAIRQLVLVIEERLGREWYSVDGRSLIDKAANLFKDAGIDRKDVLLILDNTETLARKPSEEKDLARLITQISARLARVLVTSRRHEQIEARPIELGAMKDEEGARLLRALGEEYQAHPLQQAGDARLRRISREYGGKPLLLETLARYISLTNFSIDEANKKIMQDARDGLSEFLYEDAWRRISREQQLVLLILGTLGFPVNNIVAGWACKDVGIPHTIWLGAFNETHFGRLIEYGTDYDIEFGQMVREFLGVKLANEDKKIRDKVTHFKGLITRRYKDLQAAELAQVTDHAIGAFRTGAARAAKLAASRGEKQEARLWYKEAVAMDSDNAYLYERVAYFLMSQILDYEDAAKHARVSIKLDPENPEAYFTAGLIEYRRKKLLEGDELMTLAIDRGKPEYLGWIQKGKARVEKAMRISRGDDQRIALDEAYELVHAAFEKLRDGGPFLERYRSQCDMFLGVIRDYQVKCGYSYEVDVQYRRSVRQRVGVHRT